MVRWLIDAVSTGKASMVPRLAATMRFSRSAVRVVRASFIVSSLYNVVGISIAASGHLSPVVCAILMPLPGMKCPVLAELRSAM